MSENLVTFRSESEMLKRLEEVWNEPFLDKFYCKLAEKAGHSMKLDDGQGYLSGMIADLARGSNTVLIKRIHKKHNDWWKAIIEPPPALIQKRTGLSESCS